MRKDSPYWRINNTVNYIRERKFRKIALQFPDSLLSDATEVSLALHHACIDAGLTVQVQFRFVSVLHSYIASGCL